MSNNFCKAVKFGRKMQGQSFVESILIATSYIFLLQRILDAVKCNPDPLIVKTLATLGCNFDCASRNEIRLVMEATKDMPTKPDIIYANPCKSRLGLLEAVCKGVKMVTFDNEMEVQKCASISKNIQLVLRIITDDRGSQCRLSSKFGAPRHKWRLLLAAAQKHGLQVVGVSFHVGSGCRDASRYEAALKDAREIFDLAGEYGMNMQVLDIGGGFPGETHSMWNPADLDEDVVDEVDTKDVGSPVSSDSEEEGDGHFMYFTEIAEQVAPLIDEMFPPSVRIIGEPGRYFVAACATLCCSVIAARTNEMNSSFEPEAIDDKEAAENLRDMSREEEGEFVRQRGMSISEDKDADAILTTIQEELADYSKLYATQQLAQQEVDVYNDALDFYKEGFESAADLLGPPDEDQKHKVKHSVEGMTYSLANINDEGADPSGLITLAAAGEAAVNGFVLQAVADAAPLQDDYSYYINDGVYGAFNNIMFDHATVRPRILGPGEKIVATEEDGFLKLETSSNFSDSNYRDLFASTVFGPTCDSIDVIARSVLLPKLKVGDYMYFQNMGAYTMAAASSFNGFTPSEKFYVCSVQPDYFDALFKGPGAVDVETDNTDEKKEE
jgi:diaminopimelate decarboxylase